jgi:hypothetical protein
MVSAISYLVNHLQIHQHFVFQVGCIDSPELNAEGTRYCGSGLFQQLFKIDNRFATTLFERTGGSPAPDAVDLGDDFPSIFTTSQCKEHGRSIAFLA